MKKNRKGGRPRNEILDKLTQSCYVKDDPAQKVIHRCLGTECGKTWTVRSVARVVKPSKDCYRLHATLRSLAVTEVIKKAPTTAVEEFEAANVQLGFLLWPQDRRQVGLLWMRW